jgi:hypothetical protein
MNNGDWWFHWDNAHLHTVAMVTNMMEATQFKIIENPPYLPDLAPVADQTLTQESLKMEWEEGCVNPLSDGFPRWSGKRAVRTLSAMDFIIAFWR